MGVAVRTTVCLLAATLCAAAHAQTQPTVIESVGEATIFTAPTQADFWIHLVASGETARESMDAAEQFERRLREALASKSITPSETMVSAPAVGNAGEPLVDVSARLRFNMGAYRSAETGARQFATLCDNLRTVAEQVGTSIEGPFLRLGDETPTVRQAVAKATENAYSAAESIAQELNSRVFAVSSASITEIRWNADEDLRGAQPTIRQLACTAVVRVVYEVTPRN